MNLFGSINPSMNRQKFKCIFRFINFGNVICLFCFFLFTILKSPIIVRFLKLYLLDRLFLFDTRFKFYKHKSFNYSHLFFVWILINPSSSLFPSHNNYLLRWIPWDSDSLVGTVYLSHISSNGIRLKRTKKDYGGKEIRRNKILQNKNVNQATQSSV